MREHTDNSCSVVIPFYSNLSLLELAVRSVVRQTRPIDQVVIIDDYSSERWWDVVAPLLESRRWTSATLLRNSGPSAARNLGVRLAQSEFIAFLDADDFWHPHFLEESFKQLTNHSADFIASSIAIADETAAFKSLQASFSSRRVGYNSLFWRNTINTSSVVVRKSKLQKFPEHLRHCEDYSCWLDALWSDCKAVLYEPSLSYHRKQQGTRGLSAARLRMRKGEAIVMARQYRLRRVSLVTVMLRFLKIGAAMFFNDLPLLYQRRQAADPPLPSP